MGISRLTHLLKKGLESVCWWSSIVGAIALIICMLSIVVDVSLRTTLNVTFPGTIEVVQVLLVIIFFGGMAYTQITKRHIRVDVLVNKFSPTAKLATTSCADLVALGIISIISWQSVMQGQFAWITNLNTGMLKIPLWPLAILTAFFMALFALAVLTDFLESLGKLIASGSKNYLWLVPGIVVTLALFGMSFWPSIFLPIKIEPYTFGLIALLLMFVLMFLHVHIGAAMAMITLWGMSYLASSGAGLALLGMTSQSTASNYIWSVLPLFILMGLLVAAAGLSRDLYTTAYKWVGHMPGGLASATVGACGAFAAVVGDPMTGAVTMSKISLPEMKTHKYDIRLAVGSIAAGSTIGVLIPPSLSFIVYGLMTEQSIGRLFIAGIIPGIVMTVALILLIFVRSRMNPRFGPAGPPTTLGEKVKSLKYSWAVLVLFLLVIGGIYVGIFTPTEAGAIGAFGALVIGLGMRRLNFKACFKTALGGVGMAGMVFFIFIYATAITQFFAITKLPIALGDLVVGLDVSPYVTLALILFIYLILGCLMNALPVIILTLPIVYPTVMALGFDPIWFGVLVTIMTQVGTITPPIGITVFAMAGVSDVPMYTIFRGVTPFWLVMLVVVAIVVMFPQLCLFLPNLMMGS